jgi:ribosomal protein L21E
LIGKTVKIRSDLHPWRVSKNLRGKIGKVEGETDHHYIVRIGSRTYPVGKKYVRFKKESQEGVDIPPE